MRTDGVLYNMDADPPCDTGPYQLPDGSFLALRETCADGDGDFPWLDGIRETLPYHHFVLAYRLPGSVKMDNNVWGTAWFEAYHHSSWWPGLVITHTWQDAVQCRDASTNCRDRNWTSKDALSWRDKA